MIGNVLSSLARRPLGHYILLGGCALHIVPHSGDYLQQFLHTSFRKMSCGLYACPKAILREHEKESYLAAVEALKPARRLSDIHSLEPFYEDARTLQDLAMMKTVDEIRTAVTSPR